MNFAQRQIRNARVMALEHENHDPSVPKVAFDLMKTIAAEETRRVSLKVEDARRYYCELYSQCLEIVSGDDPEEVLETEGDEKGEN